VEGTTHPVSFSSLPDVGVYSIIVGGYYSIITMRGTVKKYTLEVW
tara:strand:+ start:8339 stop:8473 length:135 start_codon:yes stop_codon:yes gene_type:complete